MDGKVKGTTGALTLEMVKIEELKMLPSNAKIRSRNISIRPRDYFFFFSIKPVWWYIIIFFVF
ncbi:MAG: hypothetical protein MUO96_06375 [Actinobacteria bacterium]|nr:hypothetical protein [Actinomycetota bacterium]